MLSLAAERDSQMAILLVTMTAEQVTNLHDLMGPAYDDAAIDRRRRSLNHHNLGLASKGEAEAGLPERMEQRPFVDGVKTNPEKSPNSSGGGVFRPGFASDSIAWQGVRPADSPADNHLA